MSEATLETTQLQVTLSPEEAKVLPSKPAVECGRGHMNDPYPHNGKCVECGVYLPSNPTILTSEQVADANRRRASGGKSQDEIARGILEDEGIPWDEATEGLRQLSLQFVKSKNYKTLELILQQIGVLKAKPKPGEETTELKYEVSLSATSVDDLTRSLSDLEAALRID